MREKQTAFNLFPACQYIDGNNTVGVITAWLLNIKYLELAVFQVYTGESTAFLNIGM